MSETEKKSDGMTLFKITGVDGAGATKSIVLEAADERQAGDMAKRQGIFPTQITKVKRQDKNKVVEENSANSTGKQRQQSPFLLTLVGVTGTLLGLGIGLTVRGFDRSNPAMSDHLLGHTTVAIPTNSGGTSSIARPFNEPDESQPTVGRTSPPSDSPSPIAQLGEIAEKGKAQAPTSGGQDYSFIGVSFDAIKSSSLKYPYVGRLIAEYEHNKYGDIDKCVVYYKYDGRKWLFAKYNRGGRSTFLDPLKEYEALMPSSVPEFNTPHGAHPKFTIWLPKH